jgi:hypothetical protein
LGFIQGVSRYFFMAYESCAIGHSAFRCVCTKRATHASPVRYTTVIGYG